MIKQLSLAKTVLLCSMVMILSGCESRTDNAEMKMQEIRNQPPLPIEPPPTFAPVPNYSYAGYQLRSPFVASSLANELRVMAGKRVYPNLNRILQPLESYTLEQLFLKGTIRGANGQIIALVQSPDGEVQRVQKGSYMGKNHGRVVEIDPNQITLIETVPDGQEGYIERPRTLVLHGEAR